MQQPWDAELVEARLRSAGSCLVALHVPGIRPAGYRSGMPEVVHDLQDAYGWTAETRRAGAPSPAAIADMDQALGWIGLIPADRRVMRRIVGARCLVHPVTDRHLYSWRRIAGMLGASHEAVRGWHGIAIGMIVGALNRPGLCAASGGAMPGPGEVRQAMRRIAARPMVRRRELA